MTEPSGQSTLPHPLAIGVMGGKGVVALPAKIYAKNPDFVHREVAGESILVPIHRQLSDVNSLYVLNETGAAVWRRIDGTRSIRAILTELSNEYDVTSEQLEKDLNTLIEDLVSIRAIEEASA